MRNEVSFPKSYRNFELSVLEKKRDIEASLMGGEELYRAQEFEPMYGLEIVTLTRDLKNVYRLAGSLLK